MDKRNLLKNFNSISKRCNISDDNSYDVLVIDPPWNQGKTSKEGFGLIRLQNWTIKH